LELVQLAIPGRHARVSDFISTRLLLARGLESLGPCAGLPTSIAFVRGAVRLSQYRRSFPSTESGTPREAL
jgi:hypothetical protein